MNVNIIRYILIYNSVIIGSVSLLLAYAEPYLPNTLSRIFYYGKLNIKVPLHPIIAKIEMPKKCFGHFYLIMGPITIILLCSALNKYLYNKDIPEILLSLLDTLLGASRKPLVPVENTILAIVLISIHCWKRAYKTYYVCVFSNQKINVLHYVLGILHYTTTVSSLIGESEGFVRGSHTRFFLHKLTTIKLICTFIFLWSTYMQLRTNFILAGLRKNQHGDVVTKEHKIPVGELFNYISNPLPFTEILLYLMLSVILWQASTFHYVTIFVIVNQVWNNSMSYFDQILFNLINAINSTNKTVYNKHSNYIIRCVLGKSAIFSDQWYRKTFKNYPKERKILIPYIW